MDSVIFKKNIQAMSLKSPKTSKLLETFSIDERVEFERNKDLDLFVKRNNISLHSLYNPVKESNKNVSNFVSKNKDFFYSLEPLNSNNISSRPPLFILGAGLFYHIEQFVSLDLKCEIVVIEADKDLLISFLNEKDISSLLKKVTVIIPETVENFILTTQLPDTNDFLLYKHNPSLKFDMDEYLKFETKINNLLNNNNSDDDKISISNCTYMKENSNFNQVFSKISGDVSLKIALVGPLYGGSLPIFYYMSDALKKLGHTVIDVDYSGFRDSMNELDSFSNNPVYRNQILNKYTELLSEGIVIKAVENKVDLVLGIAQAPFSVSTLNQLKQHEILSAFWFVEDYRTIQYWKLLAPHFDYFFTIQKGDFFSELKKLSNNKNKNNFYFIPTAAKLDIHKSAEKDSLSDGDREYYGSDISFVGAGYYNRRRLFPSLLGYDFKIWGNDWNLNSPLKKVIQKNGERVTTDESVKIFNSSKININLHSSSYLDGVHLDGDFLNPRTFELAASKNFQLVDARKPIFDFFHEDEIATFTSVDDLKEKIDFYLKNPDEREKIIEKSYNRVVSNHTYELRLQEMIHHIIGSSNKSKFFKDERITKESLLDDISKKEKDLGKDYSELKKIISDVDKNDINLMGIVNSILKKDKKLSKEESIFLMMNEFYKLAKRKKLV